MFPLSPASPNIPSGLQLLLKVLCLGAALQLFGTGLLYLNGGDTLGSWLFSFTPVSDSGRRVFSSCFGYLLLAIAAIWLLVSIRLPLYSRRLSHILGYLSLSTGCLLLLHSLAAMHLGGAFASEWAPLASASRWGLLTIIGMGMLAWWRPTQMLQALRYAIALTFLIHGLEALTGHPKFLDFILKFSLLGIGLPLSESVAYGMLMAIGGLDVAVAVAAVFWPRRSVLLWMFFWGLLTAVIRIYVLETNGLYHALMRTPHWLIPLLLAAIHRPALHPVLRDFSLPIGDRT